MSGEALLCNYLIMKVYCVFKDIFLKNESMLRRGFFDTGERHGKKKCILFNIDT